jgi:hypothetical protein
MKLKRTSISEFKGGHSVLGTTNMMNKASLNLSVSLIRDEISILLILGYRILMVYKKVGILEVLKSFHDVFVIPTK